MIVNFLWRHLPLALDIVSSEEISILDTSNNQDPNKYSGSYLHGFELNTALPLSVCLRFQFESLNPVNVFFRIPGTGTRPVLHIEMSVDRFRYVIAHEYKYVLLKNWLIPGSWYSVCLTFDMQTASFYLDGDVIDVYRLQVQNRPSGNQITVGYYPSQGVGMSYIGNLTQVNIWQKQLSEETIKSIHRCHYNLEGDIVSWSSQWTDQNSIRHKDELTKLCTGTVTSKSIEVTKPMTFTEATLICEGFGGELATPTTHDEVKTVISIVREKEPNCSIFWSGYWDENIEGRWTYHLGGKLAPKIPWAQNEPNGINFENCGGIDEEGVVDADCNTKRCPICIIEHGKPWTLRGSCETVSHDMKFLAQFLPTKFRGFGDYSIEKRNGIWKWMDVHTEAEIAELNVQQFYYPMGLKWWKIKEPICGQLSGMRQLLLTSCNGNQFTCSDGTCVDHEARCDLDFDCRDHSDEDNCFTMMLPHNYKSNVAPRESGSQLPVTAVIDVRGLRVSTEDMVLNIAFNITTSWKDNRLSYHNLKQDQRLNPLFTNGSVWVPYVAFVNTLNNDGSVLDDKASLFAVKKKQTGNSVPYLPEEVKIYDGTENPIVSHRQYQSTFTCDFDLSLYPFDEQNCYIELHLRMMGAAYFTDTRADYSGSTKLLEYTVGEVTVVDTTDKTRLKISIPLSRRYGYAFINIYVPSITMLTIGYLTLFFNITIFDARVMTALTTLLVMATLFSQVAASLPKTSYFKSVDIWLLFCIFVTFLIIVFHILIDKKESLSTVVIEETSDEAEEQHRRRVSVQPIHSENGFVGPVFHTMSHSNSTHKDDNKKKLLMRIFKLKTSSDYEYLGRIIISSVIVIFNIIYWLDIFVVRDVKIN